MRLRSDTSENRLNFLPEQNERSGSGKWFKLPKLWGGQRAQPTANNNNISPSVDGRRSSKEEEPQKQILTLKQLLEAQQYSEASQLLADREQRLFGDSSEAESLRRNEEEARKLDGDYSELRRCILQTLNLSLTPGEVSGEVLTSAVKAINQEADQDKRWETRTQMAPAWRPSNLKKLHDETLHSLVEQRMENASSCPGGNVDQSSIHGDIHRLGKQLKEDLLHVVTAVRRCYPPHHDICNFYARLYHQNISAVLQNITGFVLENKDCTFLLRWVNEYYPEILRHQELANEIDREALGKLLPKKLLEPLEQQFLSKQQDELTMYNSRILQEEKERWSEGKMPVREDGCYVCDLAYDIIQFIHGMVTSAEKVVLDQQRARTVTSQLTDLMQRFRTFQNDIIKQNKPNSQPYIKANLGCIEQFSDVLRKNGHLFQEDVRETCLSILLDMKKSAHAYLLKPVHEALKPHYRKLGTSDWLNKPLFEKLLVSLEQQLQDLQGSIASCHKELIGQLHEEVAVQYVRKLLRGEVKLKDKERQQKAYLLVKENAASLRDVFVNMGSKDDRVTDILTKIAEVLKLQDLPAIQMHVASLGTAFPDLSERHVSALLKLKTNFSKTDRRIVIETLSDTLKDNSTVEAQPFFSAVEVR